MIITSHPYPIKFIQRKQKWFKAPYISRYIFTFVSSRKKLRFVIEIDEFEHNFYAIKFYPKHLKKSVDRYNLITNNGDVIRILLSCASSIPIILEKNKLASFGFVGSRIKSKKNKSFSESFYQNKRYRIYSTLIQEVIGNKYFDHFEFNNLSAYLLLNKANTNPKRLKKTILNMIQYEFEFMDNLQ
ncbi:MAG: hypothetical protein RLZZ321_1944 [Bacteroidota bacterium]